MENTKFREQEQFSDSTKMMFSRTVFKNRNQTGPKELIIATLVNLIYIFLVSKENCIEDLKRLKTKKRIFGPRHEIPIVGK